jgi:hypothetical protein
MRNCILPATFLFSVLFTLNSYASYKLDDDQVETLFRNAEDITPQLVNGENYNSLTGSASSSVKQKPFDYEDNIQLISGIVALGSWVVGIGWLVPIHRLMLGTEGNTCGIVSLYCFTLGGCGMIVLIDGILLIANPDREKYIDNRRFIMW